MSASSDGVMSNTSGEVSPAADAVAEGAETHTQTTSPATADAKTTGAATGAVANVADRDAKSKSTDYNNENKEKLHKDTDTAAAHPTAAK
jgi:hypothetical protein